MKVIWENHDNGKIQIVTTLNSIKPEACPTDMGIPWSTGLLKSLQI